MNVYCAQLDSKGAVHAVTALTILSETLPRSALPSRTIGSTTYTEKNSFRKTGFPEGWLLGITATLALTWCDLPSVRLLRSLHEQPTECINNKALASLPAGNILVAMGTYLSEGLRFPGGAKGLWTTLGGKREQMGRLGAVLRRGVVK